MLKLLKLSGVGPASSMDLEFGPRLNLITGDNGLGKSFLLEAAWWSLTRTWAGVPIQPTRLSKPDAEISFGFDGVSTKNTFTSKYDYRKQGWTARQGRPASPGLVIYAKADGGFAVWDPARNYWRTESRLQTQQRPSSYNFDQVSVWDGLTIDGKAACNGLIRDWVTWQFGEKKKFELLARALDSLSPIGERIRPGRPAKIDVDDARQVPTIRTSYAGDVPIVFASAGMRRVVALAYLLVWSWTEHIEAAALTKLKPAKQIIFLIDEIEAHLHPKWQNVILSSLMNVVSHMAGGKRTKVQVIAATHSPLVMNSMEGIFDESKDSWFDIDIVSNGEGKSEVMLQKREFIPQGSVSSWLTSEAFDLESTKSEKAREALRLANDALKSTSPSASKIKAAELAMEKALPETDPVWARWKLLKEKMKKPRSAFP